MRSLTLVAALLLLSGCATPNPSPHLAPNSAPAQCPIEFETKAFKLRWIAAGTAYPRVLPLMTSEGACEFDPTWNGYIITERPGVLKKIEAELKKADQEAWDPPRRGIFVVPPHRPTVWEPGRFREPTPAERAAMKAKK